MNYYKSNGGLCGRCHKYVPYRRKVECVLRLPWESCTMEGYWCDDCVDKYLKPITNGAISVIAHSLNDRENSIAGMKVEENL